MGEINSQGKIYIDYSGGSYQLMRVKSLDDDDESSTEVVTAAGVEGGAGHRDKPGGVKITLEVYRESPNPEVDWRRLKRTKERFSLTTQDDNGGLREQYQGVRVSTVKKKLDDQGENMDTVELVALRMVELPRKAG
ncbi:MAG: hypothetical protein AB7O24_04260 [Kofleriaceae bacterium]